MSAAAIGGFEPKIAAASASSRLVPALIAGAAALAGLVWLLLPAAAPRIEPPDLITIAAGHVSYREAGEFLRDGNPVDAPLRDVRFSGGLTIMKNQVSRADYDRCVAERACKALEPQTGPAASTPAVGVSFIDATNYAAWLSRRTRETFRLPTDTEWAFAAGERFCDDAIGKADSANPAKRWIAAYEREAGIAAIDPAPLTLGSFGANASGLEDVAGNVWEWTSTCFARHQIGAGATDTILESCGVRTVEGAHRTYISDFIRDARGGACSAGAPPANLGMRLVRDAG